MKKIFCLLLALVACCMLATVASAETTAPTTCAAGCENPTWEPLPSGNTWRTLEAGHYHYYLTKNDTNYRYTPNPSAEVSSTNSGAEITVCLDLNGYNITTDGRSLGVYAGCGLNIMDSSSGKTGYIQGSTGDNNTVGGTMFNYGTVNLYDGTIRYVYDGVGKNQAYAGGVISLGEKYADACFNMYGGRVEGGELVVNGGKCYGGTIYAGNGSVNLFGGEVISGKVQEGYYGPCIYAFGSVQVTLSADAKVDDIYIGSSSAKVNVSGIYSGKARLTCSSTPTEGKIIGTATNTPSITGDLFCTNGDGWLVNVSGSNLVLAAFTPSGERHYCEHCKEVVKWTAMDTSNFLTPNKTVGQYHYYIAQEGLTGTEANYPQMTNGSTVCLDMYGNSLTCPGRALLPWGGATLNVMDTVGGGYIAGGDGTNNPRGGTVTVSANAVMNLYSGTLKFNYNGNSKTTKGVVAVGGTLNMFGGRIEGTQLLASSATYGGAVCAYNGAAVLNLCGGEITSGILPAGAVGPCVYVDTGSSVKLSGDAKVEDIYYPTNNMALTVSGTYTGTAAVTYGSVTDLALGTQVGAAVDAEITGSLRCTNNDWLIIPEDDRLVLGIDAPVVIVSDSGEQGYETLQKAIDGYESGCIKLLKDVTGGVTVDKDLNLDLNGKSVTGSVTVADGATLYVKDAQTDDYTVADGVYGTITASGNVCAQEGYLAVTEEGKLSFHRLTVQITAMTLRPSEAGIYYKSTFLGDEMVAQQVQSFGVALSVVEMPAANNMETCCKYSEFTGFEAGAAGNASSSTLLTGILKTENSRPLNAIHLNTDIYGRPYVKTASGYIFGEVQCRDLAEQMKDVDSLFDQLNGSQRNAVLTMYETFQTALNALSLTNIAQQKALNEETLSILMVGNSFCYYYVEELYGLLMANPDPDRGYTNVEIYNLYYSGCKLNQHYEWWIAGEAKYDLYKTDANGRVKQTPASGSAWTLEDTLQQGRWDYISLQGASGELNYVSGSVADNCASVTQYAEPLLDHFNELHPYAQLLWHRTWAFEVGRVSNGTAYTEESLAAYDAGMQAVCDYMCNEFDQNKPYDLIMVNSGAAWVEARAENAKLETSLIPEGGLCARLNVRNESTFPYYTGNANAGDGYHDGDIGGGQFLNACVWYETLTGQSVLDNPYAPNTTNGKYTLSDAFVALLRNAAHTALNKE